MTFGAPLWLLAGAAALLVFLLHARRRRAVAVPSLQIWRLIEASSMRRASVRWPPPTLLLWLQLALVALVATALAQPRLGAAIAADHVVYVLDASGSMRAGGGDGDRFAAAGRELRSAIRAQTDGSRFSVVLASGQPSIMVARQTGFAGAEPALDRVAAGDAIPAWNAVAEAIVPLLRQGETTRVVLLTDGTDGEAAEAFAGLGDVAFGQIVVGTEATPNAALTAGIVADGTRPDVWHVEGRVVATGAMLDALEVRFRPAGTDRFLDWDAIPLAPAEEADDPAGQRSFAAELELPGPGTLVIELPPDGAANDNAFYAVLDEERDARVLLLGAAPDLVRAFQALPNVEVLAASALPTDEELYDLVVVADVAIPRVPQTNVLWLARGGLAADGPPAPIADATVTGWNEEHPLSRDVAWWDVALSLAFDVPRMEGATIVAEAAGTPLVQARTTPHGREVRLSAAIEGSPWASQPGFPLFVSNLLDWLGVTRGPAAASACIAGVRCPIEPRLLSGAITIAGDEVWRAPTGGAWLPDGVEATFVPDRAGLYELMANGAGATIAVNAAPEVDRVNGDAAVTVGTGAFDLGPWILAAAVLVLVIEMALSLRASVRLRAGAPGDPRLRRRRALQLGLRAVAILLLLAGVFHLPLPARGVAEQRVLVLGPESLPSAPDGMAGAGIVAGQPARVLRDIGETQAMAVAPEDGVAGVDLESQLRVAAAMIPADTAGRIVVDGWRGETTGNAIAAVMGLRSDIVIDVVPAPPMADAEILVETIAAPEAARAGDQLPIEAVVLAGRDVPATVTVLRDGEVVVRTDVDLRAGRNVLDATVPAGTSGGDVLVEVEVAAAGDVEPGNNRDGRIVGVNAAATALIVTPTIDWGEFLSEALAVQDVRATVVTPDRAPFYMRDWLAYDVVVMLNVPAIDLSTIQQEQIRDYVGIHGRGLLLLGGEYAFGPGGYYQTPLEEVSPLSSRVPREAPLAALGFVLDRSGSMQAAVGEGNRLDIAKQATVSAVELLHPDSQVTVVVFDSEAHLVVPLQNPKNDDAVAAALAPVTAGGGTILFPALQQAFAEIGRADASARHIVVMTDGLIEQFIDFGPIVGEMRAAGITISAVAIGDVADTETLQTIARLGGGSFHATRDFRALPGILAQEALLLSGSPVRETPTPVFWVDRAAPFLAGLPDTLPVLRSYVLTSAQPGATVHLALTDEVGETVPVLASWQYGAGRVLAFASHGAGSGTQDWLELGAFPLFWSQAIRHFSPAAPAGPLRPELSRRGDEVIAIAEMLDPDGNPVAGAAVSVAPLDGGNPLPLVEAADGRYEAALGPILPGSRGFRFSAGDIAVSAAVHVGYPARLNFGRANADFLRALSAATGGATLATADEMAPAGTRWSADPAWWPWLAAALVAFLAELVLRYAPPRRLRIGVAQPARLGLARAPTG